MKNVNIEMLSLDIKALAKRYGLECAIETGGVPVDIGIAESERKQVYNISVDFHAKKTSPN